MANGRFYDKNTTYPGYFSRVSPHPLLSAGLVPPTFFTTQPPRVVIMTDAHIEPVRSTPTSPVSIPTPTLALFGYRPQEELRLRSLIDAALIGIDAYLHEIKSYWLRFNNKGMHRAYCFKDLLENQTYATKLKIFALYVLLNEKNGVNLKKSVEVKLAESNREYQTLLLENIQREWTTDEALLSTVQTAMLAIIHDAANDHSGSSNPSRNWEKRIVELSEQYASLEPSELPACHIM